MIAGSAGNALSRGPDAVRETQVAESLHGASRLLEEVEKTTEALIIRLNPALRPCAPTAPPPGNRAGESLREVSPVSLAPLAESVNGLNARIAIVAQRLQDAINRLEL